MTVWDDVRTEMENLPAHATTTEDVFIGLEIAAALTPILRAMGIEGTRQVFLKFASIAMRGLELADAEINAEAGAEQDADDVENTKCPF